MTSSPEVIPLLHQPLLTRPLPVLILLSLLATAIYSNTFSASFQFDDVHNIVENPKIKHLENFLDLSGSRYVGFLTFALNYHFGGLHVFGYHLVNLLIHITNGFLVYTLVVLLFKASSYNFQLSTFNSQSSNLNSQLSTHNSQLSTSSWVALATALLFIAHPLQTQAVTYIVQRFASLAALFYLLTVVCYLKWRLSRMVARSEGQGAREASLPATRYSLLWYAAALLSTVLAMKTKENSFTLPLMLLLVEAVFPACPCPSLPVRQAGGRRAAGRFRPFQLTILRLGLRQAHNPSTWLKTGSQLRLIPFLLTLPLIPLSHPGAIGEAEAGLAQETTEISRGDYLLTQFRVIVTYIRLLFLPIYQNLDYDYPMSHSLFDPSVFFSFLFLGSLFALAVYLLFNSQLSTLNPQISTLNSQLISFGLLWFFLTLSVESSIIPIRDVIFEHRLYLPSLGFFLSCIIGIERALPILKTRFHYHLSPIIYPLVFSFIVISLSSATYQRNLVWQDDVTLWEDVVRKAPNKARGHNNLGFAYYKDRGRLEEAIREFQAALKLQPNFANAHYNLGLVYYEDQGRLEEAIQEFQTALQLQPDHAKAHNNLGNAYSAEGRLEEAIQEFQTALQLQPDYAEGHNNLGNAYSDQGRLEEAIREYQTALRLQPNLAGAHNNLGLAYKDQGHLEEATREFQTALQLQPDYAEGHNNLGLAYKNQGRLDEAIREFQAALRLQPDYAEGHNNLGVAYNKQGHLEEAIREFQNALKLQPNLAEAHYSLGALYKGQGRFAEAIQEFEQALKLKPDFPQARQALDSLPLTSPNLAEAHYILGALYKGQGRFAEAIQEFEQALKLKPDFPQARQALDSLPLTSPR